MKNFALGFALAAFTLSSTASAGSLNDPVVEQDLVATQAAASSAPGTAIVLLLGLVLFAAAAD